jgi:hypothetical protein
MNIDRNILIFTETEYFIERRMIDPCGLFHGEIGQIVMPEEEFTDTFPEIVFFKHEPYVINGGAIGGIEAADCGRYSLPIFCIQLQILLGEKLISKRVIVAFCLIVQIRLRPFRLDGIPFFLYWQAEYDAFLHIGLIHLTYQALHPVALLNEIDIMDMHVDAFRIDLLIRGFIYPFKEFSIKAHGIRSKFSFTGTLLPPPLCTGIHPRPHPSPPPI